MVFAHIGTQGIRAESEEHPVHLVRQLAHDLGDHLEIAAMADPAGPSDPWPLCVPAPTGKVAPPGQRKAVRHDPDVPVHAPECLRQRFGRDHETVRQAQGTTEDLANVAGHLGPMQALQRQLGQIVVQFVDPEGAVERPHPGNGPQLLFADLPLENHAVDLQALQRHRLQERLAEHAVQQAGVVQRAERLTHAIVATTVGIGRMRQDPRQRRPSEQRLPGRYLRGAQGEPGPSRLRLRLYAGSRANAGSQRR